MSRITYENKEQLNTNENIPAKNKCMASDLNEIKKVVNENDTNALYNTNVKTTKTDSDINVYSCNYINEIGSCACFSKTNNQTLPKELKTQILFNQTDYVDNECFELLSDGTIKVLKDITRVQVNLNIRLANVQDKEHILYCSSTQDYGFNSAGNINQIMAMSGILSVSKNDIIRTWLYVVGDGGIVQGDSKPWCSINLCVVAK